MREPERLLSSADTPTELKRALQGFGRPVPPSSAQVERLASHIAALSQAPVAAGTAVTAGLLAKAGAALTAAALVGWVAYATRTPPAKAPASVPTKHSIPQATVSRAASEPASGVPNTPAALDASRSRWTPPPQQDARRAIRPTAPVPAPATTSGAPAAGPTIASAPTAHATPHPSAAPSLARSEDPLAREERMLEDARRLLQVNPGIALTELEQHRRTFPNGQLAAEREFLRVVALKRLERRVEAELAADQLRSRFPDTVYAARVTGVVGDATAGPSR